MKLNYVLLFEQKYHIFVEIMNIINYKTSSGEVLKAPPRYFSNKYHTNMPYSYLR